MLGLGAGGQAEYASVAQGSVARLPQSIAFADAAATPLAGLTALQALRRKAHIRPGQRVLINGASGGVGSFAVQLAKIVGCHVTGVCRRGTFEFVAGLGADDLIDYRQEHVADRGEMWDVVLDAAGNLDFRDVRRVLAPTGVMVAVAGSPLALLMAVRTRFTSGPRFTLFVTEASGPDLSLLAHLIDQGKLRPTVDRVFPLERIVEAHRYFEEGAPRGKVVIQI
jgi:NADPH:quinone reductase-like Zn-dependent oxidoreductase